MNTAGLMIAGFGVWLGSPEFDPKGKIRLSVEGAVIVAKVVEMDDTNATNRNPPRVALEVSEVLHGKHMGRYLNAEWGPPEPPYTILCGNDAYYDRPLPGPPLGIDMILVVQPTHWGTPRISGPRYSATPKRRTEARARIETLKKRWASKEVRKRRWDANKSDRRKKNRALWIERMKDLPLRQMTQKSDLILYLRVVRAASHSTQPHFKRLRTLKGPKRRPWLLPAFPFFFGKKGETFLVFFEAKAFGTKGRTTYRLLSTRQPVVRATRSSLATVRSAL